MTPSAINVLVVDDLEVNRVMLAKGLEASGFCVQQAEDGLIALNMIEAEDYDAVLLDIMMPGMSGIDVLRHIRAQHDSSDLPVVMVTASGDPGEVSRAINMGANDFVTKPVDLTVMVARLTSQIDRKRAIEELRASKTAVEGQVEARTLDLETINAEMRKEIARRRQLEAELREARRKAEAANKAKSDFLATMSHELRTPLNSIIGFSDLIRIQLKSIPGAERLDEYAAYINEGGNHLLGIVNDILDLSKIDAGRTVLNESHLSVRDLIERSVRMTDANATGHQIAVEIAQEMEGPDLFCDEILMRRALVNMIGNAIKFSEPGTRIDVSAYSAEDGQLLITIADQGIGIAAEDVARVMEPFGQANSELSRSHVGTGLGVPLTKSLVELHGGSFQLESEPGSGTTIRLFLPNERLNYRPGDEDSQQAVSIA